MEMNSDRRKQTGSRSSANLFQHILRTVEELTGLQTVIYDKAAFTTRAGRQPVEKSHRGHRCAFCEAIRSSDAGHESCQASDVRGATDEAAAKREPFLHTCHAGLIEIVVPVIFRGEQVATVFCGQAIVDGCPAADSSWVRRRALELGLDAAEVLKGWKALPRSDRRKLEQVGELLFLALGHLAESEGRAALDRALLFGRNPRFRTAVAFVDEQFGEAIGIRDVADHAGITPSHLSRLFSKILGVSFSDYLTERRISEAKTLLQRTSMTVTDIAFEVGYSSPSYFARKFQAVTGKTPSAYRRSR